MFKKYGLNGYKRNQIFHNAVSKEIRKEERKRERKKNYRD